MTVYGVAVQPESIRRLGLMMCDDLVAEQVEVDPLFRAASLG